MDMDEFYRDYLWDSSSEIWLLLAVISNANGTILAFSHLFNFPWPLIATLLVIKLYRLFLINDPVPFNIDFVFSLLLQFVSSFGDFGWKLAFTIAILSIGIIYFCLYSMSLIYGYKWLEQVLQPGLKPGVMFPDPRSPMIVKLAVYQTCFLNMFLVIVTWFCPSHNSVFQDYVGWFLIMESFVYLSCYKRYKLKASGGR